MWSKHPNTSLAKQLSDYFKEPESPAVSWRQFLSEKKSSGIAHVLVGPLAVFPLDWMGDRLLAMNTGHVLLSSLLSQVRRSRSPRRPARAYVSRPKMIMEQEDVFAFSG